MFLLNENSTILLTNRDKNIYRKIKQTVVVGYLVNKFQIYKNFQKKLSTIQLKSKIICDIVKIQNLFYLYMHKLIVKLLLIVTI